MLLIKKYTAYYEVVNLVITTDDVMLNLMQGRDELCKYKEFQIRR